MVGVSVRVGCVVGFARCHPGRTVRGTELDYPWADLDRLEARLRPGFKRAVKRKRPDRFRIGAYLAAVKTKDVAPRARVLRC